MRVLDPGHKYVLGELDRSEESIKCEQDQILIFVKRNKPAEKYPGNVDAHTGTNIQEVCRVLIDRCKYVNNQERSGETEACITHLRHVIVELEGRAAKRHGRKVHLGFEVELMPTCKICGHIGCEETCRQSLTTETKEQI